MAVIPNDRGIALLEFRIARVGNAVVDAIFEDAQDDVPTKTRNSPGPGGTLKRSLRKRKSPRPEGDRRVIVGSDHWHFAEYGTDPHLILPRFKRALWWPGAGYPRARVNHPGARAHPFMRPALRKKRVIRVVGGGISVT